MRKLLFALAVMLYTGLSAQTVSHKKHGTFDVREVEEYSIVELYGSRIKVDDEDYSRLNKKSILTINNEVYKKKDVKRAKFIKMMLLFGWEVIGTRNETRSFYNPALKSQQTVSFAVTTFAKKK